MYKQILNRDQLDVLPLISQFNREFYLVGVTAIALHIGHRQSIDFDLFKQKKLHRKKIIDKIRTFSKSYTITRNVDEQLNLIIQNVKFTFFEYPYEIKASCNFDSIIKMPDLLTLAAMKAFALGRRSKWKDYVDIYFIIKEHYSINEIAEKAISIFEDSFSEKQFRAQLSFFDDIDYSEEITYLKQAVSNGEIKLFLTEKAVAIF